MSDLVAQILQIGGALAVLAAFALSQFRLVSQTSFTYLTFNFCGSAVLAALALLDAQWGFLLLEGSWALISLWGLAQWVRGVGR